MSAPFTPLFIGIPGHAKPLSPEIAGNKAAQLWHMSRLGLAVPPAFVLPATLCTAVNQGEPVALRALEHGLRQGIAALEDVTGRNFGDARAPLLVSVRSGAAQSMPGMLDTILDVGMNATTLHGLIFQTGNPRLAWDCYRRLLQMYAEVVLQAPRTGFEAALAALFHEEGAASEAELDSEALEHLARRFFAMATDMPDDPAAQLLAAAKAVYRSWESPRAREYRRLNKLEHLTGTAVTVQVMVFGNAGRDSGAGVAFSRNPATGAAEFYADYLANAQGEDVVAGRRATGGAGALAAALPEAAQRLEAGARRLEAEFRDVQDIEFTIERGKLFFLQTRAAKCPPRAALRVLVDFVAEGVLSPAEALKRAEKIDLELVRETRFTQPAEAVASAVAAAPGVACGRAAFSSETAKALVEKGDPAILVRHDTATEDVAGFAVASGILTATGGRTAHAAVVARQMGRVCLVGCAALHFTPQGVELAGQKLAEGDWLCLDGEAGEISRGRREIVSELPEAEMAALASWRAKTDAGLFGGEMDA
ncbi:PEP/pyruvate-binding domain-containing protein [Acidocella aminolytica]|uniref:Pyruvate phosphate dikinase n=1 Tax=Acidocella aminolytica 101 = DSM 11237 TaxID=1120923 RepID=A0A0D6PDK3_9PROT|nr:PEP/pyruvate-binding domain-containing protein [Acidocella aminolytica]GAN79840.1 pyruvate phosphate dikinase [Acidocella aminolytica 101 = DSM 11237]GBQ36584.1 phosphoenolpyruvate synthase [Acidocella aminolytica 101 = DSM 11237]SHF26018.1 pyruvate phosphate dikinase [Acidocella aminolytica 101 = DSM 11237]